VLFGGALYSVKGYKEPEVQRRGNIPAAGTSTGFHEKWVEFEEGCLKAKKNKVFDKLVDLGLKIDRREPDEDWGNKELGTESRGRGGPGTLVRFSAGVGLERVGRTGEGESGWE